MRFQVNGDTFVIEFQRRYKQVKAIVGTIGAKDDATGKEIEVPVYQDVDSTYPYTTCNIVKVEADGKILKESREKPHRTYTVGCFTGTNPDGSKDVYSPEHARLTCLRQISKTNSLSDDFKAAMWDAYLKRKGTLLDLSESLRSLIKEVDPQLSASTVQRLIEKYDGIIRRSK